MKDEKFLIVFAVFDDNTQQKLKGLQDKILENNNSKGKQTMNIPFHISLGSFPVNDELKLQDEICKVCDTCESFDIMLEKINSFGSSVVFVEPSVNDNLIKLHKQFDNNFADGFKWHAHTTLFVDDSEENVKKAKKVAIQNFTPVKASIKELWLGEFFPTRIIEKRNLK